MASILKSCLQVQRSGFREHVHSSFRRFSRLACVALVVTVLLATSVRLGTGLSSADNWSGATPVAQVQIVDCGGIIAGCH